MSFILSGENIHLDNLSEENFKEALSTFQIDHKQNSYPLEVSGGELQRASLAVAQFNTPRLLVLDEPTANMDADLAEEVMKRLFKIHEKLQATLIITTHDINLVRNGIRVVKLRDGFIDKDGLAKIIKK